jgi:hypothetical protein
VTYDEGLCSYKAIAFIGSLTSISYCKSGTIIKQNVSAKTKPFRVLYRSLGEKLWIK